MAEKCSALTEGTKPDCANGFGTTAACWGVGGVAPLCCRENVCGRLYERTGGRPLRLDEGSDV